MSVTTSSANVEPPPLLFGQRSPSPFTSPPQSPNHIQSNVSAMSSLPHHDDDVDMTTSTTLTRPDGQSHDRHDADMEVEDTTGPQATVQGSSESGNSDDGSEDTLPQQEDAMDTTPDATQTLPPPVEPPVASQTDTVPPPASQNPQQEQQQLPAPDPPITEPNHTLVRVNSNGSSIDSRGDGPVRVPSLGEPGFSDPPPPPPPAPAEGNTRVEEIPVEEPPPPEEPSHWVPIQEDTSTPDERELKDIEALPEHNAADHDYWEKRTFHELEDPEYTASTSGRIEWTINNYNGTKEAPNKELVMYSPVVNIGGYGWQIKFYPRGNDTDYLSVYVECVSVMKKSKDEKTPSDSNSPAAATETTSKPETHEIQVEEDQPEGESQFSPIPLLNDKRMPKRPSVAAQASVVMYNPNEPRVNYFRSCAHRFCPGSPDWGWTRFHGPHYDIHHRHRGQRQALLRNDSLAFTAYIQIVDDQTGCLWEHVQRDNPWDSFAMTGLQGLTVPEHAPGGNLISAVSSWMLLKPFRDFLMQFKVPDFIRQPHDRPKPLISSLQKLLYLMRTKVDQNSGPIGLEDITDALDWYGIANRIDRLDVMEVWEVLRTKIEDELKGTGAQNKMEDIFGPNRNHVTRIPNYRAPVNECSTMQESVDKAQNMLLPDHQLPQVLTIELERQEFDTSSRSWKKLTNKVKIDDSITIQGTPYTLFGFISHKEHLQSYQYQSVIRPNGPGSKWYSYHDQRDDNRVICLSHKQAIETHEGSTPESGNNSVAYVMMYIRSDLAEATFSADESAWTIPEWLLEEIKDQDAKDKRIPEPPFVPDLPGMEIVKRTIPAEEDIAQEFHVFDSRAFLQHEGAGTIDAYDPKWRPGNSEFVHSVYLQPSDDKAVVEKKLASLFKEVQDPRQCKFWFMDSPNGNENHPQLFSLAYGPYTNRLIHGEDIWIIKDLDLMTSYTERRIWLHIIEFKDLPESPKTPPAPPAEWLPPPPPPPAASSPNETRIPELVPPPPPPQVTEIVAEAAIVVSEDTPMSEPEDEGEIPSQDTVQEALDMLAGAEPAVVEVLVPPPDTDMVDATMAIPSPPPPGVMDGLAMSNSLPPPPPLAIPPPPPPPMEVYFFLKYFDAENQRLESRGSHIAKRDDRLDTVILNLLGLEAETPLDLWEEDHIISTRALRPRRTFDHNELPKEPIIIAAPPLTPDQRSTLSSRAHFTDPDAFLVARSNARNFPTRADGHFALSPFSAESYTGERRAHHMHGQGTRIYHTGNVYTGTFELDQRHGHGLMVFQNGDTYEGAWLRGCQHGQGTYTEHATGNVYVGGWKQDKRFGEGVTHWKVAQETERLCRICWEGEAEAAFYDCGHVVACLGCARRVENCPVCRKRVLCAMKLFYVS